MRNYIIAVVIFVVGKKIIYCPDSSTKHVYDPSKEGELIYSLNDRETFKYKYDKKNIDIEGQTMKIELIQRFLPPKLVSVEEYIKGRFSDLNTKPGKKEYLIDKWGREKYMTIKLEKKSDSTKYPSGYEFTNGTVYLKDKIYLEQKGGYDFDGAAEDKCVGFEIEYRKNDGSYVVKVMTRRQNMNGEKVVGNLINNSLTATLQGGSQLKANIEEDSQNKKNLP